MKVLLINGSPRQSGNTALALNEVAQQLATEGIDTEILWIGNKPIRGCIACNQCATKSLGRCQFDDDICNRISQKFADSDALIIGTRTTQRSLTVYHTTSILFQRSQHCRQTSRIHCRMPSWWSNSRIREPQHAIPDDEYAYRHIAILEHRLRSHRRRSRTRHRRPTNHAHPRSQHGMASQNHQRHPSPRSPIQRTMGRNALHPLNPTTTLVTQFFKQH